MFTLEEIIQLLEREANRHNVLATVEIGTLEDIANFVVPDKTPPSLFIQYGEINNTLGRNTLTVTMWFATVFLEGGKLTTVSSMLGVHDDVLTLVKYSQEGCDIDINTATTAGLIPNNFPTNWTGVSSAWTLAWDAPNNELLVPLKTT